MYHVPVMLEEVLAGLQIRPDGIYVDATFGGGGHAAAILDKLGDKGHLFAFDQDVDTEAQLPDGEGWTFIRSNFRYLDKWLKYYNVESVDGILADLGVSSYQFDTGGRGFSYRFDAPLDMRMNQAQEQTALDILALPEPQLVDVFSNYGEIRNAKTLARRICTHRAGGFASAQALVDVIGPVIRGHRMRYLSQVFQALRIAVNDEVGALEDLMDAAGAMVATGGRLVVISYHSLEDRIVKRFMKTGNIRGEVNKDSYGKISSPWRLITRKPLEPKEEEILRNPRARSAKLRVAEKTDK